MAPKTIPKRYVPDSLSASDRKKQIKSIKEGKDRPQLESFKSKRSTWVKQFEEKYDRKITDVQWISRNILSKKGIDEIMDKGMAAYYSSGSRPNQTKESWAYARLASVIMDGPARKVDRTIWDKYKLS
jgi:hypothetical protein